MRTATRSTCCFSRPAAARPRPTSAWPRTRSRSGGCRRPSTKATDARSGDGGVAVLMRYTLRLLTAQQFQRAAALICAAEVLRRQDAKTWGDEPFRIGLWVGGQVSPNWYDKAAEEITEVRDAPRSKRTGVLQTLACPWCGTKLQAHRDLRPDDDRRRIAAVLPVR